MLGGCWEGFSEGAGRRVGAKGELGVLGGYWREGGDGEREDEEGEREDEEVLRGMLGRCWRGTGCKGEDVGYWEDGGRLLGGWGNTWG